MLFRGQRTISGECDSAWSQVCAVERGGSESGQRLLRRKTEATSCSPRAQEACSTARRRETKCDVLEMTF